MDLHIIQIVTNFLQTICKFNGDSIELYIVNGIITSLNEINEIMVSKENKKISTVPVGFFLKILTWKN